MMAPYAIGSCSPNGHLYRIFHRRSNGIWPEALELLLDLSAARF